MGIGTLARRIGILGIGALTLAACSATETVTISEEAVASATSTAIRNDAQDPGSSQEDPAVDSTDGAEPERVDSVTDSATEADDGDATTDETPTRPSDAAVGDAGCAFTSIDDFGDIQIELSFVVPLAEQEDAVASYEVYDGNGDLLVESETFFEELAPGEQVRVAVDTLTDEPADRGARSVISCALIDVMPSPFGFDKFSPGPSDSCQFREVDSFGDVQIQVNVVSPLTTASELAVDYALRGPNGVRFGDGVTFTEEVGPGGTSTTEVDSFTDLPEWVSESDVTCDVLSIQGF